MTVILKSFYILKKFQLDSKVVRNFEAVKLKLESKRRVLKLKNIRDECPQRKKEKMAFHEKGKNTYVSVSEEVSEAKT